MPKAQHGTLIVEVEPKLLVNVSLGIWTDGVEQRLDVVIPPNQCGSLARRLRVVADQLEEMNLDG